MRLGAIRLCAMKLDAMRFSETTFGARRRRLTVYAWR
jgi:hypothetical protein